jgi:GT2 family glycosyltransferase
VQLYDLQGCTIVAVSGVGVTVIVVNFNGGEALLRCMRCLAAQTRLPERIDVIDNGSTDGSVEALEAELAGAVSDGTGTTAAAPGTAVPAQDSAELKRIAGRVNIDRVGSNIGFAAANNRGIERCATPLVALLNADAFAEPEWLERLCAAAEAHPSAASFGSRQMCEREPGLIDGIGDVYHISGLPWRARHRKRLEASDLVAREIFAPCAAAALYRTDAVRAAGAFDADYFCYSEDVDLGFRLRLVGHTSRYVPDAVVHHVGAGTTGHLHSDPVVYYGHRNLVWNIAKDMPLALMPIVIPAHLAMTVASLVTLARRGQFRVFCRAKRDAIRGLPRALAKRGAVQRARRASAADIWRAMDRSWRR